MDAPEVSITSSPNVAVSDYRKAKLVQKSSALPPSSEPGATVSQRAVLPHMTLITLLRPCCHRPSSARHLPSQLVRRHEQQSQTGVGPLAGNCLNGFVETVAASSATAKFGRKFVAGAS